MKKRVLKYIIGLRDCAAVARQDDGFQLNFKTQHIKNLSRNDSSLQSSILNPQFLLVRLHDRWNCFVPIQRTTAS